MDGNCASPRRCLGRPAVRGNLYERARDAGLLAAGIRSFRCCPPPITSDEEQIAPPLPVPPNSPYLDDLLTRWTQRSNDLRKKPFSKKELIEPLTLTASGNRLAIRERHRRDLRQMERAAKKPRTAGRNGSNGSKNGEKTWRACSRRKRSFSA